MAEDISKTNPVIAAAQKQMQIRVQQMQEAFSIANKSEISTVPEIIFTTYFLPFFCGENKNDAAMLLNHWYNIAGTSYSPVNVVDKTGKVIVQVPPIQNNNHFKPGTSRENPLAYAVKVATEKGSISPRAGSNILATSFSTKLDKMEAGGDDTAVTEAWNVLFRHYGKMPAITTTTAAAVEEEDEFGF